MGSAFKKIIKRSSPNLKKATPAFVKNSSTLSKYQNLNVVHKTAALQQSVNKAPDWSDTKAIRGLLRENHEIGTTPWSGTAEKIRTRDPLPAGPERDQLTADIAAKTLRRGSVGIAVAGVAAGASSVGGIASRVAGTTGANSEPFDYSRITDPSELAADQSPSRPPAGNNSGLFLMAGLLLLKVLI